MPSKWTSRKFWNAVVGEIAGLVTLFLGVQQGEMVAIIAGAVLTIAVTLGYLKAEGDIDKARASKP
ncbi:unnamed protein product [marine sediment metagenome]|uniref:Holin n=1 Tax=marine sediment metagenome TaxID=412755 RepID=X1HQH4_9ZZZZ